MNWVNGFTIYPLWKERLARREEDDVARTSAGGGRAD